MNDVAMRIAIAHRQWLAGLSTELNNDNINDLEEKAGLQVLMR